MLSVLGTIIGILFVAWVIKMIWIRTPIFVEPVIVVDEDEIVTTTTTTTVVEEVPQQPTYTVVGELEVKLFGRKKQPYVKDPVDKDRVFINSGDDLYEDGGGKVWKLKYPEV